MLKFKKIKMKKSFLIIAIAFSIFACNKEKVKTEVAAAKEYKTAFVDTSELMKEYSEAKEVEAKYKAKSVTMENQLKSQAARLKADEDNFRKVAESKGQQWAQENMQALQKREQQLQGAQQQMMQELQQGSGTEMDTIVKSVKKFIKDYGKEKGYDYIYGTGEAATVLYAQDKYDLTKELIKLLNDKYAAKKK